jgi:hypothetical protein
MPEDATPRKLSDYLPPLKNQGMDYLVAASGAGVSIQAKALVQSGAAPFSVVLEDVGLQNMQSSDYVVITQVEGVAATVDESTKTKTGFDLLVAGDTDVHNLIIVGRLAGQAG